MTPQRGQNALPESPAAPVLPDVALGYEMPIPPVPLPRLHAGEPVLTPEQAADVLSIQHLQNAYAQLHEHGTADEIAALFHPEAKLYCLSLASLGFEGRTQIREWYAWWLKLYRRNGHYHRHRPLNQVVDLDGDRAFSHSLLVAVGAPKDSEEWDYYVGRYVHEVVREGGAWLFWRTWIILHVSCKWQGRTKCGL